MVSTGTIFKGRGAGEEAGNSPFRAEQTQYLNKLSISEITLSDLLDLSILIVRSFLFRPYGEIDVIRRARLVIHKSEVARSSLELLLLFVVEM